MVFDRYDFLKKSEPAQKLPDTQTHRYSLSLSLFQPKVKIPPYCTALLRAAIDCGTCNEIFLTFLLS